MAHATSSCRFDRPDQPAGAQNFDWCAKIQSGRGSFIRWATRQQHPAPGCFASYVVAGACSAASLADGTPFHPINATQVGLMWRVARKTIYLRNGGDEDNFVDEEPWDNPRHTPPAVPDPSSKGAAVKEHVLKMASLVDQADESELMPASLDKVQEWSQRYVSVMGAGPEEEEEATDSQLAALYKRVVILKQAPYTDFSVWVPFGRRALRAQKFQNIHTSWRRHVRHEGAPRSSESSTLVGIVEGLQGGGHLIRHCIIGSASTV